MFRLYFVFFDELLSIVAGLLRATCSKQISASTHRATAVDSAGCLAYVCPDKVVCVDSLLYLSSELEEENKKK